MPLRILNVTQVYPPGTEACGQAQTVQAVSRHLVRRGHRVTVLTARRGGMEVHSDGGVEVVGRLSALLDEQNRMHPVIAGLISEVFYEGKLRSGRRAPRRVADVPLFPAPVTWVDTRGLHGLREARGRGASLVNVPEARLVATIARHILANARGDIETGVISAYAEQTALLRRLPLTQGTP